MFLKLSSLPDYIVCLVCSQCNIIIKRIAGSCWFIWMKSCDILSSNLLPFIFTRFIMIFCLLLSMKTKQNHSSVAKNLFFSVVVSNVAVWPYSSSKHIQLFSSPASKKGFVLWANRIAIFVIMKRRDEMQLYKNKLCCIMVVNLLCWPLYPYTYASANIHLRCFSLFSCH